MNQLIRETFVREEMTPRAEYFNQMYDIIAKLLEGENVAEFEQFLDYCRDMIKQTSKPKTTFEGIHGINYKPSYEINSKLLSTIKKNIL